MTTLPVLDNPFSMRVHRTVEYIRTGLRHGNFYPTLYVVKEEDGSVLHNWFMTHLIEDQQQAMSRTRDIIPNSTMSYFQWMSFIKESV